jgi:AraC family transcriptional regulator
MPLQLLSTFDSLADAELHAAALSHANLPDSCGPISWPTPPAFRVHIQVLDTAGIDIRKLDRSAENAVRLAVMANLVETLTPAVTDPRKTRVVTTLPKWRLMRVVTYIETNIGGRITLANLAATAGLSRMYFAKQFRATTGMRPHDFVLRKRIARAQQMLAATSNTLVDIALSVGFQTQAHFTTVFKKIAGNTPCQFRREHPKVA